MCVDALHGRCRFSWYRVEASATGRLRKVKPVRIAGAHAPIYRISAADVGSRLRVVARVLGPDGSYSSASISALSGFVAASPRGARAASREKGLAPAGAPSAARPCPAPAAAATTPAPTVAAAGDEARAGEFVIPPCLRFVLGPCFTTGVALR